MYAPTTFNSAIKPTVSFYKYVIKEKGEALQAKRKIQPAELILSEPPLLSLPPVPFDMLASRYLQDNLTGGKSKNGQATIITALEKEPIEVRDAINELFGEAVDVEDEDEVEKNNRDLLAKVAKNNFTHIEQADADDYQFSVTRVFDVLSRVNHSCRPNAIIEWHPGMQQATLQSLTEISTATEITIDYLGDHERTLTYGNVRRKALQDDYGFECTCPACGPSGGKNEDDDNQRTRAHDLWHDEIKWEVMLPLKLADMTQPRETNRLAQTKLLTEYIAILENLGIRDYKILEAFVTRAKYNEQGYQIAVAGAEAKAGTKKYKKWATDGPCYYLLQSANDWEQAERVAFGVYGKGHPHLVSIAARTQELRAELNKTQGRWEAGRK